MHLVILKAFAVFAWPLGPGSSLALARSLVRDTKPRVPGEWSEAVTRPGTQRKKREVPYWAIVADSNAIAPPFRRKGRTECAARAGSIRKGVPARHGDKGDRSVALRPAARTRSRRAVSGESSHRPKTRGLGRTPF